MPGCIKPTAGDGHDCGQCRNLYWDCSMTTATWSAPRWVSVIIWASPFGPLRFDYAVPLTKGQFDRVQQFKFGGGTSF